MYLIAHIQKIHISVLTIHSCWRRRRDWNSYVLQKLHDVASPGYTGCRLGSWLTTNKMRESSCKWSRRGKVLSLALKSLQVGFIYWEVDLAQN